jgi:dolichol-phosphate mannosyltransferase
MTAARRDIIPIRWHLPILLGVALLLFGARLSCPLLEPEETRYAEIPRQMLAQGRVVEPVWHGEPYYHKPPLLYWLVMASYRVLGVSDAAARLVPTAAAVLLVLLTYAWARAAADAWTAFVAALLLCLSARFVYLGRMVVIDGLLALWVTAALAAAHLAVQRWRWRWWLLAAACCGLGLLTKGPVALALVLPPVTAALLFRRLRLSALLPWCGRLPVFVAVAVAVAAPWYGAVALHAPDAAADFFWQHNVRRFTTPFDHVKPFWFYLPLALTGTLPWSLLLLPLAWRLFRGLPLGRSAPGDKPPTENRSALYFWLTVCGWCLLFFSLSGCKRHAYLLPALPALALVLGGYLAQRVRPDNVRGLAKLGVCAAVTCAVLLAGVQGWLPEYHRKFGLRGQVRRHRALADDPRVAVYCYPHRWDGVSFYLQRDDVRVFAAGEWAALAADLERQPRALVFVKAEHGLAELRAALPPTLEVVPCGRQSAWVAVGLVRPRGKFLTAR